MEATGLPDASFDLVAVQFVTHECPSAVIESLVRGRRGGCWQGWRGEGAGGVQRISFRCFVRGGWQLSAHACRCRRPAHRPQVRECRRLLRLGGCLAIVDNNPRSKVIQNLPPVLFTLMKR